LIGGRGVRLHYESLAEAARRLRHRTISPVELAQLMLDRIAAVDGRLHAFVTVTADRAMDAARRAEAEIQAGRYRGPLHGIPVGVKDLCDMRGVATGAGTKVLSGFMAESDADVVANLEEAGAVILGKQALCEGAFGPYHPGLAVPVNPWEESRWSGVSSSGSAVAVAAGLCFGSIATDTGGSIRYPAAANGCVGLKPTYGRVSRHGVFPLAPSMDHVGAMARTVEDAAMVFDAIAGPDTRDPTTRPEPFEAIQPQLVRGIDGLRVGFDRRYATDHVEPETADAVVQALAELGKLGTRIVSVTMPDLTHVRRAWYALCIAEAAKAHARTFPGRAGEYGAGLRIHLEKGLRIPPAEIAAASDIRSRVAARIDALLAEVDCLACPSMSNSAQERDADPTVETNESWRRLVINDIHAKPFDFSGSPTLSVPCGFTGNGLPLSIQFVGRALGEAAICRIGHAYQQATGWHARHPEV
jgi:amidase